jgi:hypothetical protein
MIAGLPWQSWLLLLFSTGLGLGMEIAFFRAHRKLRNEPPGRSGRPDEKGAAR